jgi:hypothetical protein
MTHATNTRNDVHDVTYEFPTPKAADEFAEDLLDLYGLGTIMPWGSRFVSVRHTKPRELIDELADAYGGKPS